MKRLNILISIGIIITGKFKRGESFFFASRDSLTGLCTRKQFEKILKRRNTEHSLPVSIIVGDVNGLRHINETRGYAAGDRLLFREAGIFMNMCGKEDIAARWGEDEFIALLHKTPEAEAEKICKTVAGKNAASAADLPGILSLGYATAEGGARDIDWAVKTAEKRMNDQKLLEERSSKSGIVCAINHILREKSRQTWGHSNRLRLLCRAIGSEMGLPEYELCELELLALLHDIGKIAIMDSVLNKTDMLTESEWKEMKKHPEIGARIVRSSKDLRHIADYILSHHERPDGGGYPMGLKGEDIPLASRILAVADAYDAMTNERPYRRMLPGKSAVEELVRYAGTQFDRDVVKIAVERVVKIDEAAART